MRLTWLVDGELAASGMIFPEDVPILLAHGIEAVLSLTERSPFPDGSPGEVLHLHLPLIDMTAPTQEELGRAVEFLGAGLDAGRPTLVHCGAGLGRTGTVLAAFLVSRGLGPVEAIRMVRTARPGSIETVEQEDCIFEYAEAASHE